MDLSNYLSYLNHRFIDRVTPISCLDSVRTISWTFSAADCSHMGSTSMVFHHNYPLLFRFVCYSIPLFFRSTTSTTWSAWRSTRGSPRSRASSASSGRWCTDCRKNRNVNSFNSQPDQIVCLWRACRNCAFSLCDKAQIRTGGSFFVFYTWCVGNHLALEFTIRF